MALKELLGHESIERTLRYAHLPPDVKRDTVRLLDAPSWVASGNPPQRSRFAEGGPELLDDPRLEMRCFSHVRLLAPMAGYEEA